MPNSSSSPSNNLYDWQKHLIGGIKSGELVVLHSGRSTGKSMLSKYMMNTIYGKTAMSYTNKIVTQLTVTKAYKGEWKVEVPWQLQSNCMLIREFEAWCHEIMGSPGRHGRYRWRKAQLKYGTYFVRNEQDVLMLTLRWAGV